MLVAVGWGLVGGAVVGLVTVGGFATAHLLSTVT